MHLFQNDSPLVSLLHSNKKFCVRNRIVNVEEAAYDKLAEKSTFCVTFKRRAVNCKRGHLHAGFAEIHILDHVRIVLEDNQHIDITVRSGIACHPGAV